MTPARNLQLVFLSWSVSGLRVYM